MGMFGGIGKQVLNIAGRNLLGVDFEAQKRRQALLADREKFNNLLAGKLGPQYDVSQGAGDAVATGGDYQWKPPQKTGDGLNINSPDLPTIALQAQRLGVPITQVLDVLKAQQPEWQAGADGRYINKRSSAAPRAAAVNGIVTGEDGAATQQVGFADAQAGIEGAKVAAQEDAKAARDMVEVKMGGQIVQLPRSVALPLITAAFGKNNPNGLPTDFGRTRSPEEQALLTGRAGNTVKQEGAVEDATTQAKLDLPKIRDQANSTLDVIRKIREHPSLSARTGNSTLIPALRPEDVDFDVLVKQIGGGAFLEAIAALKGSGQITEIEGQKATEAVSRMQNQRQSEAGFKAAMNDYERIVKAGLDRTENRAAPGSRPTAPAIGAVVRGYRFLGGNPADPKSWARN